MQGDFAAFCHRQSTKMVEYAGNCTDPALKDQFLQMSAYWLKIVSAPSGSAERSVEIMARSQYRRFPKVSS